MVRLPPDSERGSHDGQRLSGASPLGPGAHPGADFWVGDMFALPFEDDRFDVATSFNGIWKGCEDALREARRVVTAGWPVGSSGTRHFATSALPP